ncbi:hypothetical protein C823_004255 [Eubacterium plexicaudatum ASF492]|nr:hypothetical protein C823_004255 [Eubacterium plexicaudatum ASF492]
MMKMEKKNIDWENIGFNYQRQINGMWRNLRTACGKKAD